LYFNLKNKKMTTFTTGITANRPQSKAFAGKAQMPEVLCGVLTPIL
jgi:hypothetical protein